MSSSGSHMSTRPPPKPNVLKPIDSRATLPVRIDEVGPGNLAAVFLLDRPQQPARLVEVHVVRPAVERREPLLAVAGAAAAVADAVGAGAVPRHPDEQRPVVAEVGRPPLLRVRHQGMQVLDHGIQVEGLEFARRSRTPRPSGWTARSADAGPECSAGSATSHGWPGPGLRARPGTCPRWRCQSLRPCSSPTAFGVFPPGIHQSV